MVTHPSPVPVRLLLVATQQLLRESLALFLAATPELQLIGQIDCDLTHLHFIKASPPDLILVDVDLPAGPDPKLITAIRQHFPTLPVVVLTSCTQSGLLRQLLALNIQACLSKAMTGQALVDALLSATKSGGGNNDCGLDHPIAVGRRSRSKRFCSRQSNVNPTPAGHPLTHP